MTPLCTLCNEPLPPRAPGQRGRPPVSHAECRDSPAYAAARRDYARRYYHANRDRVRSHGLLPSEKSAALKRIGWKCEVCAEPFVDIADAKVDHDHACCPGKQSCGQCIRGFLCGPCNSALGHARDSPATLRALADYLERT
jgi:hypothetical protein